MARITSAREISEAGLASQKPPSGPRLLRTMLLRRRCVRIVSRNRPGIFSAQVSCSLVTGPSAAAASSIAARSA
jgi:hypothetical protein